MQTCMSKNGVYCNSVTVELPKYVPGTIFCVMVQLNTENNHIPCSHLQLILWRVKADVGCSVLYEQWN